MSRLALLLAIGALAAGCGGNANPTASKIETPATTPTTFAGGELKPPRTAPPIALHDDAGQAVTLSAERGRYVLVTFLYVHCPDVCPLIAANLNQALRGLGPKRDRVRVLAVSVDPKGDTPTTVRSYSEARGLLPQFRYLIGTPAELRTTWAAWHVLSLRKSPDLVDHVTYTALVDPAGRERVLYDSQVKARQVLHDLHVLMQKTP